MLQPIPKAPYIIYDATTVTRQYKLLRSYLDASYPRSRIYYALKACYVPHVVKQLLQLGSGLEISSLSEQQIALHFGLSGRQIVWNGPGLDVVTLRGIVDRGEIVNIDSAQVFHVLEQIAEEGGREVCAGLRLNIKGHGKLGVDLEQAGTLLKQRSRLRIAGFHFHPANGFKDPAEAQRQRLLFLDIVADWEKSLGIKVEFVNLGGGFAIGESPHQLFDLLVEKISALKSRPELFLEPGAYLVAEAGNAYANVVAVKTVNGLCWAILDIGSNFLVPLQRSNFNVESTTAGNTTVHVSFGGPLCYDADVIAVDQQTEVRPGDIMKITRCGAYTASMASNFSSLPPPIYWQDTDRFVEVASDGESSNRFLKLHGYSNTP